MEQKKDRRAVGVKVLPEGVEEYCERHTTALTELHERLLKETEEKTTTANFLVGEIEGAFLKMLVRMTQAKRILEVGMFTGYSALSFAEALPPDGSIITCELDPHAIEIARRFLRPEPACEKDRNPRGPGRRHVEKHCKAPSISVSSTPTNRATITITIDVWN